MAFMNQEKKKALMPALKKVLAKYGIKATFGVRNYSTLVCNIRGGKIDFIENYASVGSDSPRNLADDNYQDRVRELRERGYFDVNHYWIDDHFDGVARDFLMELKAAMMVGNHDRSDAMTDYFDVGWYIDINVGSFEKPYELTA